MDLSAPAILKKLDAFRKTEWFTAVLLVVLGLVSVGLFQFTTIGGIGVCLGILLPPVTVFVIPYWLGERRIKRFALYILPVILIATLLITALQTQAVVAQGKPNLSSLGVDPATPTADLPTLTLWNGTVEPYNTPSANATYAFHVRLKAPTLTNLSQATVSLNMSELVGLSEALHSYPMVPDPARNDTSNGTWYVTWRPLGTNVYAFQFVASYRQGNTTLTTPVLAPILAPWTSFYVVWLISIAQFMIYPASFYFVILFMYWYTIRARKMRERLIERAGGGEKMDLKKGSRREAKAGEEPSAPAPPRDKTKKAAAFTCTNCGADVTEDDTKCPKCGAVFED